MARVTTNLADRPLAQGPGRVEVRRRPRDLRLVSDPVDPVGRGSSWCAALRVPAPAPARGRRPALPGRPARGGGGGHLGAASARSSNTPTVGSPPCAPGSVTSTTARPPTPRRDVMFEQLDDPRPARVRRRVPSPRRTPRPPAPAPAAGRAGPVRWPRDRGRRHGGSLRAGRLAGAATSSGSRWRARRPSPEGEPVTVLVLGVDGSQPDGPTPAPVRHDPLARLDPGGRRRRRCCRCPGTWSSPTLPALPC